MVIADDGVGIEDALLAELKDNMRQGRNLTGHIGIYNVNKRIKLLYGDGYGLDILSGEGKGTTVMLRVPYEEMDVGCY